MKTRLRPLFVLPALGASILLVSLAACVGSDPTPAGSTTPDPTDDSGATTTRPDGDTPVLDTGLADVDAGADAGPQRFCATQSPLLGFTDFFCADFDGTNPAEGFTKVDGPDAGTLTLVTDLAFSPPSSIVTGGDATLEWDKVGAASFSEIDAEFEVNTTTLGGVTPPATGWVVLFEITTIDTELFLKYSKGGTVEGNANYTGYYIEITSCTGACALLQKAIPTLLPVNTWTKVSIAWTATGAYKISYNGVPVLDVESGGLGSTSTKITTILGLQTNSASPAFPRTAFDNFVVSVKR